VWSYTFDDHGGYDNMTSAFLIWYGDHNPITVDIRDMPDFDRKWDWDERHQRLASAESLAQTVVNLLNSSGATAVLEGTT
jgi:hypothetical protein